MRSFILFLTVVSFISSALANPNLKPWHFLKPGKRDTVGGCDTDESNMQKAWTEVIAIIKAGTDAIALLNKAQPDKSKDYDGHMQYQKAAASLKDLMDIDTDANAAPQTGDAKEALDYMENVYTSISSHADGANPPSVPNNRKKLFCGDKFAVYVKDGDAKAVGQAPPKGKNWWIDFGGMGEKPPIPNAWQGKKAKDPNNPGKPFCGDVPQNSPNPEDADGDIEDFELNAATYQPWNYVYFCPRVLNGDATIAGKITEWAATRADTKGKTPKGTSLNDVRGLSRTMFHEFIHLYNPIHDLPAPKMLKGVLQKDANGKNARSDGKETKGGAIRKIYGYTWAYGAARSFPYDKTQKNVEDKYSNLATVDSYVMFAMSMFFSDSEFVGGDGRAMKIPPKP